MEFIVIAMASDKTSDNLNVIYTKNFFFGICDQLCHSWVKLTSQIKKTKVRKWLGLPD